MTGGDAPAPDAISWTQAEPRRLARDRDEIEQFAPEATYHPPDDSGDFPHGGWTGTLPRWPFDRPEPDGLQDLIGVEGLPFALQYSAAHPMVAPVIHPLDPEPGYIERTQTAWHVAPSGALCLLRNDGAWQPEASVVEFLLKAAGWRVEYALMKAAVIDRMSVHGIVSDASYDHLVRQAAFPPTDPAPEDPAASTDERE